MALEKEMQQMINALKYFEKKEDSISKSSVGWHIDHCLRVIYLVCKTLEQSDDKEYKSSINLKRTLVFFTKKFPRGKVRAPKTTVSKSEIDKEVIKERLETTKILLKETETLPKKSNFTHRYFGMLNLDQAMTFLEIHTRHHLSIINDIISYKS